MYFCKNCGEPYLTDEAVMCVKCGVSRGLGTNYCHNCGNPLAPDANVCMACGVPSRPVMQVTAGAKSKLAAGLLGIFLGCWGVHNFYLGYTTKAVIQLVLTLIGYLFSCILIGLIPVIAVGIWGLVEGIMILTGAINKDGQGRPLIS